MKSIKSAVMAALMAASAMSPSLAEAQERDKVRFALPLHALSFAHIYIAMGAGHWTERGLDVETPLIAGTGSTNAMLAGQTEFTGGTGVTLLLARGRGQTPTVILSPFQRMTMQMVLSKKVADAAGVSRQSSVKERAMALKGKNIGIDRPNAIPHSIARYILSSAGMDPERDVTFVTVDGPTMPSAVKAERIDSFVMSAPWTSVAIKDGYAVDLFNPMDGDFAELWPMAYQVVMAREGYCESNVSICERFVQGLQESVALLRDDIERATDLLQPFFKEMDRELIKASLVDLQKAIPDTFVLDDERVSRMQEFAVATGQVKPVTSFTGFYTNAYLAK